MWEFTFEIQVASYQFIFLANLFTTYRILNLTLYFVVCILKETNFGTDFNQLNFNLYLRFLSVKYSNFWLFLLAIEILLSHEFSEVYTNCDLLSSLFLISVLSHRLKLRFVVFTLLTFNLFCSVSCKYLFPSQTSLETLLIYLDHHSVRVSLLVFLRPSNLKLGMRSLLLNYKKWLYFVFTLLVCLVLTYPAVSKNHV